MADSGVFSDTDESAVEELLSQAQDLSILEQISAINCSSFSHSELPPDLDSRFRRLKSFPLSSSTPSAKKPPPDAIFSPPEHNSIKFSSDDGGRNSTSGGEKGFSGRAPRPTSPPSDSSPENNFSSPFKHSLGKKTRAGSESPNSWLESESPSPPRKSGCFWCSPRKVPSNKSKERKELRALGSGLDEEFLADLGTLSEKEQRKLMKKAMEEEEKINREAEKIVNLAKQASARIMSFHGLKDDKSEDETSN